MSIKQWLHRVYKKSETDSHILRYLFLEITRRCNLKCLHCGSDCKAEVGTPELTTNSWIKIIDSVATWVQEGSVSPELAFVITGGEPLVHSDLECIGHHIVKRGLRWTMVTNGLLLDKNRARSLENAGVSAVTLSLDGLQKNHDWLRNHSGTFDKVMRALNALRQTNIPMVDVVSCVFPNNLSELDTIARLLLDEGVHSWRLFRIFPLGRAANSSALQLSFNQTQDLLRWIAKHRDAYAKQGLSINYSCEGYLPIEQDLKVRNHGFFCWAGVNIASILADGTITGCTNNASRFHVGNILQDDFLSLWENGFDVFRDRGWAHTGICTTCSSWKDCLRKFHSSLARQP